MSWAPAGCHPSLTLGSCGRTEGGEDTPSLPSYSPLLLTMLSFLALSAVAAGVAQAQVIATGANGGLSCRSLFPSLGEGWALPTPPRLIRRVPSPRVSMLTLMSFSFLMCGLCSDEPCCSFAQHACEPDVDVATDLAQRIR
jgi:hypothetical protein